MTKTALYKGFIDGAHVMGEDGLRDYHTAQAIKAAVRIKSDGEKFMASRKVLHPYRVMVSLVDAGIRLYRADTKQEIIL